MSDEVTITEPANGLFGPGIFGTGIDLSALDEQTAYRLGIFMGEQLHATAERARAETLKTAARSLTAEAEAYNAKWCLHRDEPATWDMGYVAGLTRAAHDLANGIINVGGS